eukprot:TRINITY_DN64783_c4_g1_i1.p1 TRINITY_DN64783_c4_g1~~TRINITY_DN64783_c4_g1_i1.p1  ORF type:complete len:396 (+),score=63.08 TRINITY_DN64783_c4_g1_i1:95-1282(+)
MLGVTVAATLLSAASAKIYFKEDFNDKNWEKRWTKSTSWKPSAEMGEWKWTAGEWYGDASDKGIQTGEDARFYGISAPLNEKFTNKDKDLVLQLTVKHEQQLDCGGAYIKLMGDTDQASFGGDSPYQVMFGPDICGSSNRKTHAIFHYDPKDTNLESKTNIKVESDQLSHLYTLVVKPSNDYEVFIDDKSVSKGNLEDNWEFLLPKQIKDPSISKPKDWVDAKKIPDPDDVKPDGYDDIPAEIVDPSATMPEDWDEEEDGEWEAPMIPNPEYKGPWKPKMIDNPEYKGEWKHPMIPNPDYKEDPELHVRCKDCTHVGFELWQVKSGTIFDDIIVTDSLDEAREYAQKTFFAKQSNEKAMFDAKEAERMEAEKAEREAAAAATEDYDDEDDEHDEL